jgi:translation elongation factor EF-4
MSLVMENSQGKSFLFNMLDTPGHLAFSDEGTTFLLFGFITFSNMFSSCE